MLHVVSDDKLFEGARSGTRPRKILGKKVKVQKCSAAARVCSSQQQQQRGRTPGWEVFPS